MAGSNPILQIILSAKDEASALVGRVSASLGGVSEAAKSALEPLRSFGSLIAAAIGIGGAKELSDRADAFTRLSNQIKVASKDEADYHANLAATAQIAKDTNSNLDSTAQLYGKVTQNAKSLHLTQQQVADVTALVSKGMQLSGASTEAAAGATLQLTQALASGVLRGDEFNSVMEASPALIKAIADGLGVQVGEMRALAEAGQLTSSRVVQALLSQKKAIDETYGKLGQTSEQAFTQLSNAATLFIGRLNEQTGATRGLSDGLTFLANNMDAVAALAGASVAAAFAKGTAAIIENTRAALAARAAAREQAIASEAQQRAAIGSAQANLAAAQAAYNRALAEQRAAQAQLAALESLAGLYASEEALVAARAQSSAAVSAATAATERYTAAQAALNAIQTPAATGVGIFSRALGLLTGPGGMILAAVSAFGLLYAAFSKQKEPTDTLTQSTEQYTEALRKMTAAQAQVELNKLNAALEEQRQRVDEARVAYEQATDSSNGWIRVTEDLGPALGTVTRIISDGNEIAKTQAELHAKLDTETQRLADTEARRAATLDAVNSKQQIVNDGSAALVASAIQSATALDKAAASIQSYAKYQDDFSKAQQSATQALLEKAQAENNVAEVARLSIQLAQQQAEAAQKAAELAKGELSVAQAKVTALESIKIAQGALNEADTKALDQAQQAVAVKSQEAAAAENLSIKLAAQAKSEESGVAAKQRAVDQAERNVDAAKNYVSALESVRDAQLSGLQVEIDGLRQKGLTFEAQQKSIELAKLNRDWLITLAEAKKLDLQADLASAQAKLAELQASQNQSEATKLQISSINLHIQALTQQLQVQSALIEQQKLLNGKSSVADLNAWIATLQNKTNATEQDTGATNKLTDAQKAHNLEIEDGTAATSAFSQVLASQIQYWKDETAKLSDATKALFEYKAGLSSLDPQFAAETFGGVSAEVVKTQTEIQRLTKYTADMRQMMLEAPGDIARLFESINAAGADAENSYQKQKLAAEQLEAQIKKVGETGGSSFASVAAAMQFLNGQAQTTTNSFWLLNDQDLSQLKDSISKAKDELKALQEETQNAADYLDELNSQLARSKGDTTAADLLDLQLENRKKIAAIEENITKAQIEGNQKALAIYQEQLRVAQQIYEQDQKNIKAKAESSSSTATPTASTATPTASTAGLPGKTYTLNLTAGGQTLTTTTNSNPSSFLDALEASRLRTT